MKFLLIVGHGKSESGGYDPGAVNGDLQEFQIAREIAKSARDWLRTKYGADCDLMNYERDLYLQERIDRLQDHTYDFVAEIHLNAATSPAANGTEVYYFPGDTVGQGYAESVCMALCGALGTTSRGAKASDYYGIIRATTPTAILVETCFISNPGEVAKVSSVAGQEVAGQAVADGIATAAGLVGLGKEPATAEYVTAEGHWEEVEKGKWRFVTDDGSSTGGKWLKYEGGWYFFGPDGIALKGEHQVGGVWYHFMKEAAAPFKECQALEAAK